MTNVNPLQNVVKIFISVAVVGIGVVHLVTAHFPTGLLPVAANLPGKVLLPYLSGAVLIVSGLLILVRKFRQEGALLMIFAFLTYLFLIHIPALFTNVYNPGTWTGAGEILLLLSGSVILYGHFAQKYRVSAIGRYVFAMSLIIFVVQHYIYAEFITTIIPAWIPWKLFWNYAVLAGFLLAAISFILNREVYISSISLGLMFLLWCFIVHGPRVYGKIDSEPEWTSFFVSLAASGISFFIATMATDRRGHAVTG